MLIPVKLIQIVAEKPGILVLKNPFEKTEFNLELIAAKNLNSTQAADTEKLLTFECKAGASIELTPKK